MFEHLFIIVHVGLFAAMHFGDLIY